MSMFHELMMRKKEEIMYATIKGSLTENDGVFSGFSGSNYLQLQKFIDYNSASSWEIKLVFTTGNDISTNQAIYHDSWSAGGVYINIVSSRIRPYFNFGDNFVYGYPLGTIQTNTKYYCKLLFTGTQYKILLSTDNHTWNEYYSLTDNRKVANQTDAYGYLGYSNRYNTQIFLGSIDLNNSYIKLGSTKYKLQAVVGYTKVGSPTITDGVMTRADASDTSYIYFNLNEIKNSIKVNMKFKVTTLNVNSSLFDPTGYSLSFRVSNANKIVCRIFPLFNNSINYTVTGTTTIQSDTWYWVRVDLNKERVIVYLSLDGITYTQDGSLEFETQMNFPHNFNGESVRIGYSSASNLIIGSIDLNNTDVNIDNKLYFNGQQS